MLFSEAQIRHATFLFDLSNSNALPIISSRFIFGNQFFIPQFHCCLPIIFINYLQSLFNSKEHFTEVKD